MISVNWIVEYEAGELDHQEVVDGFQAMIDDGSVWQLQGSYEQMAHELIDRGYCTRQQPPDENLPQWRKRSRTKVRDKG